MGAVKISVSLEEPQLRWLRRQAKSLGTTVSALMAEAVADLRRARERERLLERLGGRVRISDRETAELRRAWDAD
jgi:hypothetical protein